MRLKDYVKNEHKRMFNEFEEIQITSNRSVLVELFNKNFCSN